MNSRPGPMASPLHDTAKMERVSDKGRIPDFLKLIEELKQLRTRSYSQELSRLEEQHQQALENAGKDAHKRPGKPSPEDLMRLQSEARRFVDAEHDRNKEMVAAKFQKLDGGILVLTQFLQTLGPVKELEVRLAGMEEKLRKEQDELNVQRKVLGREQEELEHDKELIRTSQLAVREKQKEFEAKLANLDVVKRARELDLFKKELDGKIKAYELEEGRIGRERDQLNRDFESLGQKKAELESEGERLETEKTHLANAKASMADVVAKEMALTFEAFLRDMLKPQPPVRPAAPPKPPAEDEE